MKINGLVRKKLMAMITITVVIAIPVLTLLVINTPSKLRVPGVNVGTIINTMKPQFVENARGYQTTDGLFVETNIDSNFRTVDGLSVLPTDTSGAIYNATDLLKYVCKNGFEHHVAMNASHSASILAEAFETYMGWDVYHHQG